MNESNLDYLQDQVKFTGFGEELAMPLKEAIDLGAEKFALNYSREFGKDSVSVNLNFSKSKTSDMYFFNSYQVNLQKEGSQESTNQTFYINKGSNISLREAYNMMEGRSVYKKLSTKDGEEYNAWVGLDFKQTDASGNFKQKQFSDKYGFDIEKVLDKHPIKELESEGMKEELVDSIKRGNMAAVTYIKGEVEEKRYVSANPQFKSINFYDERKEAIGRNKGAKHSEKQGSQQSVSTNNNETTNTQDVLGNSEQDANKEVNRNRRSTATEEAPDIPENRKRRKNRNRAV
ncbi:hypothetical protein [Flavobacterium cerinum]|uniref:DUF3945 domain-containing protein n=1 Tax=Flavobacterium cerinum TaxID=2502784 RepID=A0ABY5IRN2_9FLAO|nr:hypothetical protein [Flavobacterium cerinum]UUC44207.1 hypothetical protein NOX80_11245 [Flavobacterium cerinum]